MVVVNEKHQRVLWYVAPGVAGNTTATDYVKHNASWIWDYITKLQWPSSYHEATQIEENAKKVVNHLLD